MDAKVYDTKKRIMQLQYLLNHKNMHFAREMPLILDAIPAIV